jgi:hypothetical protein
MHLDVTLAFSQFIGSLPIFVTVILAWMQTNGRISDLRQDVDGRMSDLRQDIDQRFRALTELMDSRFDAQMQALLRVEQVMDARLKHLEERER